MRSRHRLRTVVALGLGAAALLLGACSSAPGSQRIVGPSGLPMAHVHCGSSQGECFRIAGELCPGGYDIRPVLAGSDGNFLVHCHDAASAGALASTQASSSAPARNGWPPSPEPAPAAYPWPASDASASAHAAPATTSGEIDLGY